MFSSFVEKVTRIYQTNFKSSEQIEDEKLDSGR